MQTSAQATAGTPDAFGGAPNLVSYFRVTAIVGVPGPPDDSAMGLELVLDDVRCVPSGARCGAPNASGPPDYTGEVAIAFTLRLTDHENGAPPCCGLDPATVEDTSFHLTWPVVCGETASTAIGSSCSGYAGYYNSLNFWIPGAAVKDGKRAIYEFDDVRIYDGGADGDADTTADNTVFLRPGIFIP